MENQQQQQSSSAAKPDDAADAAAEAAADTAADTAAAALIDSFIEITCASKAEALFFLESHNFDLDAAVSTFLESSTTAAAIDPSATSAAADAPLAGAVSNNSPSRSRSPSYSPSRSETDSEPASPSRPRSLSPHHASRRAQYNLRSSRGKAPSTSSSGDGIRTRGDRNRRSDDDGSDSDPDYEPIESFTGSEKSGMPVRNPWKANVDVRIGEPEERPGSLIPSKRFKGTPRKVSGKTVAPDPPQVEENTYNVIFWNNGFTVNDGPLRRFDDPENQDFLESMKKTKMHGVHIYSTRKEENYPEQVERHPSFQGVGRTLGSTSNAAPTEPTDADTNLTTAPASSMGLIVDDTQPTSSIQLRLGDGTRMVSRFNYHHTIRDIRGFIDASRPGAARTYQLQTVGFPPKQLTDLDETIEQAGLGNSVVIQKLA